MDKKTRSVMDALRQLLIELPRVRKSLIVSLVDLVGTGLCAWGTVWLVAAPGATSYFAPPALLIAVSAVGSAWLNGLYRSVIRYVGVDLIFAGGRTAALATVVGGIILIFTTTGIPIFRWTIVNFAFVSLYLTGSRYAARRMLVPQGRSREAQKVLIFGAGSAGAQLAVSLRSNPGFRAVGMVDDDPAVCGQRVKGLDVYPTDKIRELINRTGAQCVLLAIPSASRQRRRQVLERLSEFPIRVQTIPAFKDIVTGKAQVDDLQDVDVKDLLGRDPVPPNPDLLAAGIASQNVLVTGAGGSIGSELCRQILKQGPARLVLFELSETALYGISRKLAKLAAKIGSDTEIIELLGSVHHEDRVREVISTFKVNTVYHAAAFKHVPIVEQNLLEGIHNNVFGTLHTVRAAIENGVHSFVLISTDKAVNPTSVMGATKRLAELVVQAYAAKCEKRGYCMVRFGNVLDSSGSVVPLFKEQIRSGGPVTVTHRDIIRYFMTIPEAAELVIQAGSMARGGDVFVLDMGEPVRIRDLAERMIKLMGLTVRNDVNPDGDIEIKYVGLRPAEKLYEELLIGANVSGTEHQRILRADEDYLPIEKLDRVLIDLANAAKQQDCERARDLLMRSVREYQPTNGIDDLVWLGKSSACDSQGPGKVVEFLPKH